MLTKASLSSVAGRFYVISVDNFHILTQIKIELGKLRQNLDLPAEFCSWPGQLTWHFRDHPLLLHRFLRDLAPACAVQVREVGENRYYLATFANKIWQKRNFGTLGANN